MVVLVESKNVRDSDGRIWSKSQLQLAALIERSRATHMDVITIDSHDALVSPNGNLALDRVFLVCLAEIGQAGRSPTPTGTAKLGRCERFRDPLEYGCCRGISIIITRTPRGKEG